MAANGSFAYGFLAVEIGIRSIERKTNYEFELETNRYAKRLEDEE